METYTLEALGRVIREHRESKGLTQEALGTAAGYSQASAGVSISRLEGGNLAPKAEKMAAIAEELNVSLESLRSEAAARSEAAGNTQTQIDRIRRASAQRNELAELHAVLLETRGRVTADFLDPLRDLATRIRDANPDPTNDTEVALPADETAAEVAYQLKFTRDGLQRALAEVDQRADFGHFAESIAVGVAAAATLEAALPSAAARKGFLAAMGLAARPRITPGAGLLAAVAAGVAAGAFVDRQQSQRARRKTESAARLDEAEAELARTQPNVDALQDVMARAVEIFEYASTHAAHALTRLSDQLGGGSVRWESLSDDQQRRYANLVEIAAAILTITTIDLQELAESPSHELELRMGFALQILAQAFEAITSRV